MAAARMDKAIGTTFEPCQSRLIPSSDGTPMRSLLPMLLLVASFLAAAPPASAATGIEPLVVLEDPAGDISLTAGVPGTFRSWDLRALSITDDEDTVTFRLGVDQIGDDTVNAEFRGNVRITFHHGEVDYILYLGEVTEWANTFSSLLYRWSDVTQSEQWVANGGYLEPQGNELVMTYPKLELADESGALPFQGRSLEGFAAQSNLAIGNVHLAALDRMPDTGEGGPYAMRGGLEQSGIALWSLAPYRSSNGEATTFVYDVNVENHGPATDLELTSGLVPPGWTVEFPRAKVHVPAQETIRVQALATVPFAHEHGTAPSFLVEARGAEGQHGQIRLGVNYPKVPVLSGHHPEVYLHSRGTGGVDATTYQAADIYGKAYGWMTPQEQDDSDEGIPIAGRPYDDGELGTSFFWYVSGRDQSMGLDLELEKPVTLRMPVRTDVALDGAQFIALFYVGWPTGDGSYETVELAWLSSEIVDLPAGTHEFVVEGLPTPDADRIEPHKDMYTGWNFWLNGKAPTLPAGLAYTMPLSAALMPGGRAHLPVVEFHDAVEEVYAEIDGLQLTAAGPEANLVNPGKTMVVELMLTSPEAGEVHVALRGAHAAWARVVGDATRNVAAGAEETVRIAVVVPADAHAQQLDLLVEAHGPRGATALLRLGGAVVTHIDVPDEAELAGELRKDAPMASAGLVLAALLLLAFALRRRA